MSELQPERLRGRLRQGVATSILLHSGLIFPLILAAFVLGSQEQERRESEVEMSFESVPEDELPQDLPPIEEEAPAPQPPDKGKKKAPEALAEAPPEKPPEKPVPEEVPVPEKLPPLPPEEKPPTPPPPKPERAHEKLVDVQSDQKDQPPPKDAKFLAEKNNTVNEETRATDTNLEREQKGTEGSTPNDRQDQQIGDDKDKIAELEDQKSKLGRAAPNVTPHLDPEVAAGASGEAKPSILSMRSTKPQAHAITPETADPSLPRDPDGTRAVPIEDLESAKDLPGHTHGKAPRVRLSISGQEFQYLFGKETDAAAKLAQKERSKKSGRFAARLGRVQSALENFIPEVKPGNQTALNTRAAPFAAFIARMHRNIHKLWGFGFLEDLDAKPQNNPYNDPTLATKLELVLNADGTVDKIGVIRTSGYTPFDAAAVDVAYSAAPYPDPPGEIRSGNGKIYVHWTFHRDERQCSTAFADYFILDNSKPGDQALTHGLPAPGPLGKGKRAPRAVPDDPAHQAKMAELDRAAGGPEAPPAGKKAGGPAVRADDPAARAVAERWFDAYASGDVGQMLRHAAFPFHSSGGVAARDPGELRAMLSGLLEEAPRRRGVSGLQLYSAAGARGALGTLPPGFGDGQGLLFAVGQTGRETFVLALAATGGNWRAVGLVRR